MRVSAGNCAECGNLLQNGRCPRCDANRFARARRWRTGDRGGKRPERRFVKREFQDALDGVWKNTRHDITVHIDTEQGIYRSIHGRNRDTTHVYNFQEEANDSIHFYKDTLLIEAIISSNSNYGKRV